MLARDMDWGRWVAGRGCVLGDWLWKGKHWGETHRAGDGLEEEDEFGERYVFGEDARLGKGVGHGMGWDRGMGLGMEMGWQGRGKRARWIGLADALEEGEIKIVAARRHTLRLKCTKFDFGWGSAPDPSGGAHSAPPVP